MNIFKKLFGNKKKETQIDHSKFSLIEKIDYTSLDEMIEQNAGLSFEKQLIFANLIESQIWNLDIEKGNIDFGKNIDFEDMDFPIQIIGSFSFNDNSWMWGWANTKSIIPKNLLIQSNQLKKIGEKKNIKELIDGHFNVEEGFEHKIGMMASGLFNSSSYYCANYGQGTLVMTIDDKKIPKIDKSRLENILTYFPQLISKIELNHRNTFQNYLIDRGLKLLITENKILGLKEDKVIIAEFDKLNRLKSLDGKI